MSGASFTPLQTTNEGGYGMSVPTLALAEQNGATFLSRLGVKSIAEARSLSAEAVQAGTGGGLAFRPVADGYVLPADPYALFQQANSTTRRSCSAIPRMKPSSSADPSRSHRHSSKPRSDSSSATRLMPYWPPIRMPPMPKP